MGVYLNPTAGLYNVTGRYLDADMERIRLAGQVRPDMSPQETYSLFQQDKALALQSALDKVNADYLYAWQQANAEKRKKEIARKQANIESGLSLYG